MSQCVYEVEGRLHIEYPGGLPRLVYAPGIAWMVCKQDPRKLSRLAAYPFVLIVVCLVIQYQRWTLWKKSRVQRKERWREEVRDES